MSFKKMRLLDCCLSVVMLFIFLVLILGLNSHTNCPVFRAGIVNNTAMLPSEEMVVQNSGMAERTSGVGVSESSRGVGRRGSEDQASDELQIGIGNENDSLDVIGVKIFDFDVDKVFQCLILSADNLKTNMPKNPEAQIDVPQNQRRESVATYVLLQLIHQRTTDGGPQLICQTGSLKTLTDREFSCNQSATTSLVYTKKVVSSSEISFRIMIDVINGTRS